MWRLIIGLGCIPGVVALYFRLTIAETPRYIMFVEGNVYKGEKNIKALTGKSAPVDADSKNANEALLYRANPVKASIRNFIEYFSDTEHLKTLIGTSVSWFILDVSCLDFPRN